MVVLLVQLIIFLHDISLWCGYRCLRCSAGSGFAASARAQWIIRFHCCLRKNRVSQSSACTGRTTWHKYFISTFTPILRTRQWELRYHHPSILKASSPLCLHSVWSPACCQLCWQHALLLGLYLPSFHWWRNPNNFEHLLSDTLHANPHRIRPKPIAQLQVCSPSDMRKVQFELCSAKFRYFAPCPNAELDCSITITGSLSSNHLMVFQGLSHCLHGNTNIVWMPDQVCVT